MTRSAEGIPPIRLDLELVELFCRVVEEGSFSKAAKVLSLSQPTVSGHIKNLEAFVGTPLINRLPRRIVLTRAGELLYSRGQVILREKDAAARELTRFLHGQDGGLVLCGSTIPSEYLLPPVVAAFHARFPGIRIEIRVADSRQACDEILSGRVEVGFVGARFESAEIAFRPFASDELVLVAPCNTRWGGVAAIALADLASTPFLAREHGSGTRLAFETAIGRPLDSFNLVGSFGSTNAIKEALKAGLGVSVVSSRAVAWELSAGLLKTVRIEGAAAMTREFYAVTHRKLSLSPIADAFLACAVGAQAGETAPRAVRGQASPHAR